jgi:hypothetical protein
MFPGYNQLGSTLALIPLFYSPFFDISSSFTIHFSIALTLEGPSWMRSLYPHSGATPDPVSKQAEYWEGASPFHTPPILPLPKKREEREL